MSALPFDSTHTWPRSLQPLKVPRRPDEAIHRSQAQKAIVEAQKFVESAANDLFNEEAKSLARTLADCLKQYHDRGEPRKRIFIQA